MSTGRMRSSFKQRQQDEQLQNRNAHRALKNPHAKRPLIFDEDISEQQEIDTRFQNLHFDEQPATNAHNPVQNRF